MKKLLIALGLIAGFALAVNARDNYSRDVSVLPVAARDMLKKNFKADMSFVKIDKSMGKVSDYEVVLVDGTEVTFDTKGNWTEIEASTSVGVPDAVIPQAILNYVKANHKNVKIVSVDKERSGYDVELANGIDMKFNASGNFLRYD